MPDGKRNSLPPEGETEGVNGFYNDDEDIQNSNSAAKRLPLSLNTRGYHNLSERLLKAMVANEIKKTLDVQDNKKLVAHHRPVLHSENDISETDMVVVGVVLNAKQSQNDEVSKAIEMLRRNGVSCVYFTIKDQPGGNGVKKDDTSSSERDASVEEKLNESEQNENKSEAADKKVSSPTVSTTSDYTSPPDDVIESLETNDASCTSTTVPILPTIENVGGPNEKELVRGESPATVRTDDVKELDIEPPTLSPSPPVLFPQELVSQSQNDEKCEEKDQNEANIKQMPSANVRGNTIKRKKRRTRITLYRSRRRPRNKKPKEVEVKVEEVPLQQEESVKEENVVEPISLSKITIEPVHASTRNRKRKLSPVVKEEESKNVTLTTPADPYEFEESDTESSGIKADSFKTPTSRSNRKIELPNKTEQSKKSFASPLASKRPATKKKRAKGSPRKRLTFTKLRALSPDITDPGSFRKTSGGRKGVDGNNDKLSPIKESTCVQPISMDRNTTDTNTKPEIIESHASSSASLPSNNDDITKDVKLVPLESGQCDADIRFSKTETTTNPEVVSTCDNSIKLKKEPAPTAQVPSNVQTKVHKKEACVEKVTEPVEFLAPAPPNDSLQDASDSMHLRRSSFYSSISRNVRTNLEKYLDGRPQDLKAPKRSKKIKNGFLLHHGDNFPDDPEAPYRLHLATQVLLKLNKRRVKFKPKEDKGKSLLSYLKLQPKRVSRVGKHSKAITEETEASSESEPTTSVFSGEWTVPRKYICNICGQVENAFWDMVMHKGEVHPGIVVTHVELPDNPPEGFRNPPSPRITTTLPNPPPCSKCATPFTSYDDLHRHIFECAGNATVLEEPSAPKVVPRKRKGKRKRGFKRRISSLPKKNNVNGNIAASKTPATATTVIKSGEITKRRNSEVFKCEFCAREFKTEGWLKNHVSLTHSLPVSIPLEKLSLPTRASISCSRRIASQLLAKPSKQISRET